MSNPIRVSTAVHMNLDQQTIYLMGRLQIMGSGDLEITIPSE